jgi:hypothetical protein
MRIAAAPALRFAAAAVISFSLVDAATAPASGARQAHSRPAGAGTPAPFTMAQQALPYGADGVFYSAILATKGGFPACAWFLQGSLPHGLQLKTGLTCQAQIVGVPASADQGTYHFEGEVYDNIGRTASASFSIKIRNEPAHRPVGAIPPAPVASHGSPPTESRPSWSGYVVAGQSLNSVTGTFTVPYIPTSAASCAEQLGVWDGLDGANSVPGEASSSLIQAGIAESMTSPNNGTCAAGHFYIWPWWEILPGPEVPIFTMNLNVGDRVTVMIWHADRSNWDISLHDDTNGQDFTTRESYAGPAGTAEWIVEATEVPGLCGSGVDPQVAPGICHLAPYAPEVTFDKLALNGSEAILQRQKIRQIDMVQDGSLVSIPSKFAGDRFSVAYTGNA